MGDNSGPEEGIKGVVEGVKGKAKEVGGALTGKDDLKKEGEAQQDKADAQRDAAKKEAYSDWGHSSFAKLKPVRRASACRRSGFSFAAPRSTRVPTRRAPAEIAGG
jgi:uncharacterized protein YjbJ (UPF0337 family)